MDDNGKIEGGDNNVSVNGSNLDVVVGTSSEEQRPSPLNAWVRCDDCHKWRRIPVELADLIEETKRTWYPNFAVYIFIFHGPCIEAGCLNIK